MGKIQPRITMTPEVWHEIKEATPDRKTSEVIEELCHSYVQGRTERSEKAEYLRAQLTQVDEQLERKRERYERIETEIDELQQRKDHIEDQLEQVINEKEALQEEAEEKQREAVERWQQQLEDKQERLAKERERLEKDEDSLEKFKEEEKPEIVENIESGIVDRKNTIQELEDDVERLQEAVKNPPDVDRFEQVVRNGGQTVDDLVEQVVRGWS